MLKILYFSGAHQISTGIKPFYERGRKRTHLLAGVAVSGNLLAGEATGAHLTGAHG